MFQFPAPVKMSAAAALMGTFKTFKCIPPSCRRRHTLPAAGGREVYREGRTDSSLELYETASLDAGADDYIVKKAPVSMLLSRLHAHLSRRERDLGMAAKAERRVAIGRFTLDRKAKVLLAGGKPIKLSQHEMQLLEMLASSPSRIFSSEEILDVVWGDHIRPSLPALSGLLRRLRQKMAKNELPDPVENIRGRGFRLLPSIPFNA
jgi:DNA-binding response OmpR family regulator